MALVKITSLKPGEFGERDRRIAKSVAIITFQVWALLFAGYEITGVMNCIPARFPPNKDCPLMGLWTHGINDLF